MKTALVIVDMQEGFINDYTYDLTSKIRNFVDNNDFDLIIETKYINHENTACYKYEGWKGCMRGTDEVSIVQELADVCDEVFEKDKYSCWNDDFIDILKSNEIDRLVFVGVNTGCCVLNSVFDAYNDLFDVVVIKDLCGSTSGVKSHKCAIQILEECITKERVITSSEYKIRGDLIVYNITE